MSDNKDKKTTKIALGFGDSPEDAVVQSGLLPIEVALNEVNTPREVLEKGEGPLNDLIRRASGTAGKKAPSLSFTELPGSQANWLGVFKPRTRLLPPELIKVIRVTDHLVAAILRTRGNIMKLYGHLKKDRFDVGLEVSIKPEILKILTPEQYEKVVKRTKRLETLLLNCGHNEGLEHQDQMTLSDFMSIQTINGLSFGSHGTEIIYDRSKAADQDGNYPFHRFRPVDIATIFRAVRKGEQVGNNVRALAIKALEAMKGEKFNIDLERLKEDEYAWLQLIEMQVRQAFTHNEMIVYNLFPSTDIEHNGYPVSPLDTCINCITTHISIEAFWKTYFANGKSAKGMLVIQSDEVDQQMIDAIKMQFNASINSVSNAFRTPIFGISKDDTVTWTTTQDKLENGEFSFTYDQVARNILSSFGVSPDEIPGYGHLSKGTNSQTLSECLDPETEVVTNKGLFRINELLKNEDSVYEMVWNGNNFVESKIFKTGKKKLKETVLRNGLSIKTSPDHRFKVVGLDGEPVWKQQSEIVLGDYVLTNKKSISSKELIPSFKGKELTLEMVEIFGWMSGDGTIVGPKHRSGGLCHMFYHHEKEPSILLRHKKILSDFGLNPICYEHIISEEQQEKIRSRYGFKSVASKRIGIRFYDTEFVNWMFSIGFEPSKNGKVIPKFLHTMPEQYKGAFLKGLFSADGHLNKSTNGAVYLTISNEKMRNQVRSLLMSMGIRTNKFQGSTKEIFLGSKRKTVRAKNKLSVKDKRKFFDKIGFLQPHKQPMNGWLLGKDPIRVPINTQIKYINMLIGSDLPREHKRDLYVYASGEKGLTVNRLLSLLSLAGLKCPDWVNNYYYDEVVELIDHKIDIDMVDLTLFDDSHAFVANGIIVHNSNNEFKMTAARDSGLRPLILGWQTYFNQRLIPIIDPELSQLVEVKLSGLDAQSKEQESARLQQDSALFHTYDSLLSEVDEEGPGKAFGGEVPFNERYRQVLDFYETVGSIRTKWFGDPSGIIDPMLNFRRDPFALQYIQLLMQINPNALRAMAAPKPHSLEFLKMEIEDMLEDDNTGE